MKGRKPVIGLSGGIASGKSIVAEILGDLGCGVIRADTLNHRVLNEPQVRKQIQSWWGEETYDSSGQCDRGKLAAIVFADVEKKRKLEALTHPLIGRLRDEMMEHFKRDDTVKAIVLDVPLLFEVRLDQRCDKVIFVQAAEELRKKRACQARGWSEDELQRREKLQIPLDIKRNQSDYIVENNSDISTLRQRVELIFGQLISSFQNPQACSG